MLMMGFEVLGLRTALATIAHIFATKACHLEPAGAALQPPRRP
jgi:hypothetical protein